MGLHVQKHKGGSAFAEIRPRAGHHVVRLPFKPVAPQSGGSYGGKGGIARGRFGTQSAAAMCIEGRLKAANTLAWLVLLQTLVA